jgi:type I restriction-modification system DNA methylase subunit
MDASQYKDYVLVLLFIKYVSDKYAGQPYAPITVPSGASFKDMVALTEQEASMPASLNWRKRTAARTPPLRTSTR